MNKLQYGGIALICFATLWGAWAWMTYETIVPSLRQFAELRQRKREFLAEHGIEDNREVIFQAMLNDENVHRIANRSTERLESLATTFRIQKRGWKIPIALFTFRSRDGVFEASQTSGYLTLFVPAILQLGLLVGIGVGLIIRGKGKQHPNAAKTASENTRDEQSS